MHHKILQLCPIQRPYHAVYYNPKGRGEDKLIYVDVPMFALTEAGNGKIEVCPLIVLRNGEASVAWETEDYIGCAEVDVNDDDYWLDLHDEQQEEERSKKGKGKNKNKKAEPVRHTDEDDEDDEDDDEDDEDDDDEEPEGEVHISGKRR